MFLPSKNSVAVNNCQLSTQQFLRPNVGKSYVPRICYSNTPKSAFGQRVNQRARNQVGVCTRFCTQEKPPAMVSKSPVFFARFIRPQPGGMKSWEPSTGGHDDQLGSIRRWEGIFLPEKIRTSRPRKNPTPAGVKFMLPNQWISLQAQPAQNVSKTMGPNQ